MALFTPAPEGADIGYMNLRAQKYEVEQAINAGLEALWATYEPYADTDFPTKFAQHPDEHFWEMYLTVSLLEAGKKVRSRAELTKAERDTGPDICVLEEGRKVWIECVAPGAGIEGHPDSVPELTGKRTVLAAPRRQVELRITSSLLQKREKFRGYQQKKIVAPEDVAIIAFSGANFWAQSSTVGLPAALSAVYPVGDEYFVMNKETFEVVKSGHALSTTIPRKGGPDIDRTAFLSGDYAEFGGLMWSRRTIGSFLGRKDDFVYVHNASASQSLPTKWTAWCEEYPVRKSEDEYRIESIVRDDA
jgi:hypothetical protein